MKALNDILNSKKNESKISGNWYLFQWIPDISCGEKLNIGVGFRDFSGEFSILMLDYYDRINCLYGKEMQFQLELACNVARELAFHKEIDSDTELTPQIRLEKKGFAQGSNASEILKDIFVNVVPLSKKIRQRSNVRFSSTSRDSLYNSMKSRLRINLDLDYSFHVPENPYMTVKSDSGVQSLYLPFKNKNGFATLVSTAYSDIQRVKCNLFDGYRDIDIASNHLDTKNNAVFLMLPDNSLKRETQIEIENELDKFIWMLKPHKFFISSRMDSIGLADDISDWCKNAA